MAGILSIAGETLAADGTWTQATSGGNWSDSANWAGGNPADGSGFNANFNSLDLTADNTVHLDTPRTIGNLIFGDTDPSSAAGWELDNGGNGGNILTLDGGAPTITVNALGVSKLATISAVIGGTSGLTKAGGGRLNLSADNTYTGGTTISAGTLQVGVGGATGSLGGGNIVNNGSLVYSYDVNTGSPLPTNATYSGNGDLYATAGTVQFMGDLSLGMGALYYSSTSYAWGAGLGGGAGSATITAGSASLSGPIYCGTNDSSTTLTIDTSASNGPITLSSIASGHPGAFVGYSNLAFNAGTGTINIDGTNNLSWWNAGATVTLTGQVTGSGSIGQNNQTGDLTVTLNNPGSSVYSGVISGAGIGVTKSGAGTQILTGSNTYAGPTTIDAGTLQVGNGTTVGSLGSGNIVNNANLVYSYGPNIGVVLPTNATYSGNGDLSVTTGNIRFNGDLSLGIGSFTYNATSGVYPQGATSVTSTVTAGSATLSGPLTFFDGAANEGALTIDTSANDGPIDLNGIQSGLYGNYYSFTNLAFNAGNGTITIGGNNIVQSWKDGETITLTGQVTGSGNVTRPVFVENEPGKILTLAINNPGSSTYSGTISGPYLALAKTGAGTQTLDGNSTYEGATTINAGVLELSGAGAINGTSGITINGGELKQNSSTAVSAPITLTAGTISGTGAISSVVGGGSGTYTSPGNSVGIQDFNAGLDYSGGMTYDWELGNYGTLAGIDSDLIHVNDSNLTLGGASALSLSFIDGVTNPDGGNSFWDAAQSWKILDVTGAGSNVGGLTFVNLLNGSYANGSFSTSVGTGADLGDIFLNYTPVAVPEPGTLAMLLFGSLGFWRVRKKRGRASV